MHQVSTHGYSQNQILVWKYPSLVQVAKLTGHSYRVLYLVSTVFDKICIRELVIECVEYAVCLRKKYGVADYQHFKNGNTQQCNIFRHNTSFG